MKVLIATMSLELGGAETHVVELALELKRRGHTVIVTSHGGRYVETLESSGIRHETVPLHSHHLIPMLQSYRKLKRLLNEESPDLVHTHARIPAFLCSLLQKKHPFIHVSTVHRIFDHRGLKGKLTRWGETAIAVSEDIRQDLIHTYHRDPSSVFVTVNGIDTAHFSPVEDRQVLRKTLEIPEQAPVLLHASRLDDDSWLAASSLLDIASSLHKMLPGLRLLILGDGTHRKELESRADEINRKTGEATVQLLGARTDISPWLASADLFVGTGRSALEALSSGIPCILAGNDGFLGLFTPDKLDDCIHSNFCCRNGVPSSPENLISSILEFNILNTSDKARLSHFSRKLIQTDYSVQRMVNDVESAYASAQKPRKSVVICGYYGYGNVGDEAILQAIVSDIRDLHDNTSITVLTASPEETTAQYNVSTIYRYRFSAIRKVLRSADFLLFGGGGLLQDKTSTRSLLYYLRILELAQKEGTPILLYANGIGPIRKTVNQQKTGQLLSQIPSICVRDPDSRDVLSSLDPPVTHAQVTGDATVSLPRPLLRSGQEMMRALGWEDDTQFLVVCLREPASASHFLQEISILCDRFREELHLEVLFLPMSQQDDGKFHQKVLRRMKNTACIVEDTLTAEEILSLIGNATAVISMRYHAVSFALQMQVPCLPILYDEKMESCARTWNLPYGECPEEFTAEDVFPKVEDMVKHRRNHLKALESIPDRWEEAAKANRDLLRSFLDQRHA